MSQAFLQPQTAIFKYIHIKGTYFLLPFSFNLNQFDSNNVYTNLRYSSLGTGHKLPGGRGGGESGRVTMFSASQKGGSLKN